MSQEIKMKNSLSPQTKKELISISIAVVVMILVSVLVVVAAIFSTKQVDEPKLEDNIFGVYTKEVDSSFTPSELVLEKYLITGEIKSGVSYVSNKSHSFETGFNTVSGNVKLEVFIDEDGVIVKYQYLEYNHSSGNWQTIVGRYLDEFIGTQASEITQTMTSLEPTGDDGIIYAGATETTENVIIPILKAIETEVNK